MWAGGGGRGSPQRPPEGGVESRRRLGPHREPGSTHPCDLSPRVEVTFGQGSQSVQGDLTGASEGNHNPDLPPFPPAVARALCTGPTQLDACRSGRMMKPAEARPVCGPGQEPGPSSVRALSRLMGQEEINMVLLSTGFLFLAVQSHE